MFRRILVLIVLLAAALGQAQPGPVSVNSLEALVLTAGRIAVFKVRAYEPDPNRRQAGTVTFTVDTALRGSTQEVQYPTSLSRSVLDEWLARRTRLLIFLDKAGAISEIIPLQGEEIMVFTADLRIIRNEGTLLRQVKAIMAEHPGVESIETFHLRIQPEEGQRLLKGYKRNTGMGLYVTVPLDARLEKLAKQTLRSAPSPGTPMDREMAAKVLGRFKSAENIETLKSLLADTTSSEHMDYQRGLGKGVRRYFVRMAAHEALTAWGISVPQPVLEEEFFAPERVTYFRAYRPMSEQDFQNLTQFSNIGTVHITNTPITAEQLALICRLPKLQELDLAGMSLPQNALKEIGRVKGLTTLNLASVAVTAADLAHLRDLQDLTTLVISGRAIDDKALEEVVRLRNLRHLSLYGTHVTPAGLRLLSALSHLETLNLTSSQSGVFGTDASPSITENLRALRAAGLLHTMPMAHGKDGVRPKSDQEVLEVWFYGQSLPDDAFQELVVFTNLENLTMSGTNTTDKSLPVLKSFPKLKLLNLGGTSITDDGLKHVAGLKGLTRLAIHGTGVTNDGLAHLSGMVNLRDLILGQTKITDEGLRNLAGLAKLEFLMLNETAVTDAGLRHLIPLKNLQRLNLHRATNITDRAIPLLGRLPSLREVSLTNTGVTDQGVLELRRMKAGLQISR